MSFKSRSIFIFSLLVALVSFAGCERVFFYPTTIEYTNPREGGVAVRDVYFRNRNGDCLHSWFLPATGPAKGTLLFVHGNAENITSHVMRVYWLPRAGFNVFLLEYRGYGRSEGTPTIAGLIDDTEDALLHVGKMPEVDPHRIILFGQSLGGAIAVNAAVRPDVAPRIRALVLDSAFSSFRGIVRDKLDGFWVTWPLQLPLSFLVGDSFSPIEAVRAVHVPVLLLHGEKDPIVPSYHSARLFDAANEPKSLWTLPDVGHIGVLREDGLQARFVAYLEEQLRLDQRDR